MKKQYKLKVILTLLALLIILMMGIFSGAQAQYADTHGTIKVQIGDSDVVIIEFKPDDSLFIVIDDNFDITYERFSFGRMILSIEDLVADPLTSYISISVNGKYSLKGIDEIELVDGMLVAFELVEF